MLKQIPPPSEGAQHDREEKTANDEVIFLFYNQKKQQKR